MTGYRTKQKTELLEFLKMKSGEHLSVQDIVNHFQQKDIKIGTTTIYRHLNRMVADGIVKKIYIDDRTGSCFEYVGSQCSEHKHQYYHLKCEQCEILIHFECYEVEALHKHVKKDHGFQINPNRTIFYGLCNECSKKEGKL